MARKIKAEAVIAGIIVMSLIDWSAAKANQEVRKPSWPEVKCARYKAAWADAIAHRGTKGLSREFMERHEAYLSSGCTTKADVCPRSDEGLYMVDMMEAAVVNAGIAGTFLPFMCRN